MKNHFATALLLTSLLATISACTKSSSSNNTTSCTNDFAYVANNHQLVYDASSAFYPDTAITTSYSTTTTTDVYKVSVVSSDGNINQAAYLRPCTGKLFEGNTASAAASSTMYGRKSTTTVGETWSTTSGTTTYNYKVVAKNVTVVVPAGTFTCDKITYNEAGTINTDTIYYSPAIGDVKYDGVLLSYDLRSKNF